MSRIIGCIVTLSCAIAPLLSPPPTSAQAVDISGCASGFYGKEIALRNGSPHDAFIAAGAFVRHVSTVSPGSRPCVFGPFAADIPLGAGIGEAWGAALDNKGNLYVSAGANGGSVDRILKIEPPYTGPASVYFAGAVNLRALAIQGNVLYAADHWGNRVLRFALKSVPTAPTVFAAVPSPFGIYAAGVDDIYVTSNAPGDILHITRDGVTAIAHGLSYPEGIGSDDENLYVAAGSVIYVVLIAGGVPAFYANGAIFSTHGVTVWKGAGYTTDSHGLGEVHKFSLR